MQKLFMALGGSSGFIAVILGAFGAHALKEVLTADQLATFNTGNRYQIYHSLALLFLALVTRGNNSKTVAYSGYCFITGIVLFSGSLYLIATKQLLGIENWTWLGPVTPVGGLFLIAGWLLILISAFKIRT